MRRRDFGIRVGALPAALPFTAAAAGSGIDQNPIRRRGVGLRGWNRAQASPGLTLFTPMNGEGTVYLMDLNGKIGHTWEMPYPPGLYGYLTERGTLFYNGKIPTDSFLGRTPFRRTTPASARIPGSLGWVSNRNDLTSWDALNAAGTLIASPTAASSRTRPRTVHTTTPRCAPRSIRIPISGPAARRCRTSSRTPIASRRMADERNRHRCQRHSFSPCSIAQTSRDSISVTNRTVCLGVSDFRYRSPFAYT